MATPNTSRNIEGKLTGKPSVLQSPQLSTDSTGAFGGAIAVITGILQKTEHRYFVDAHTIRFDMGVINSAACPQNEWDEFVGHMVIISGQILYGEAYVITVYPNHIRAVAWKDNMK